MATITTRVCDYDKKPVHPGNGGTPPGQYISAIQFVGNTPGSYVDSLHKDLHFCNFTCLSEWAAKQAGGKKPKKGDSDDQN